ncbi:MAG: flagellin [Rhodospirillales bacterium]
MSYSIVTNVASMVAQENLRVNNEFQHRTINRVTSGYRINASGDDAAGLAVANKYRSDIAELTQGVRNANDGISTLQIVDGGLNNISKIIDRLKTLATQSASSTFSGSRATLNDEYQALLKEIDRQAANIGLVAGGANNSLIEVYIGGGSSTANAKVKVDLSGAANRVDSAGLGIAGTTIAGGGTTVGNVDLHNNANVFLANGSQVFTFELYDPIAEATSSVAVTVTGGATGISGADVLAQLNTGLSSYGITAVADTNGNLAFGGTRAFSVSVAAPTAGTGISGTDAAAADNQGVYRMATAAFSAVTAASAAETLTFQSASGSAVVVLDDVTGANVDAAIAAINAATASLGIYALASHTGANSITIQSSSEFSMTSLSGVAGTGLVGASGLSSVAISDPDAGASATGNAVAAITALTNAVSALGLVQGRVGTGQNKLQYAISLAQSQISNFSAAESRIRDADIAAEAANLTKAQVLQQASLAAMAQANSAPQGVLTLLRG